MFEKEMLFILGAGASVPYGYPLGKELIKNIIDDMEDEIFLPYKDSRGNHYVDNKKYSFDENDKKYGRYYDIKDFYNEPFFALISKLNLNDWSAVGTENNKKIYKYTDDQNNIACLFKIKINELEQFHKLKESLEEFDPISIDTFLRDNGSHAEAGKTMIIYSLLKRENREKFKICKAPKKSVQGASGKDEADNWYSYFLNDLLAGCADNPENILSNKLSIVTFNYDLSLDYYIHSRLSKIEVLKTTKDGKELWQHFWQKFKDNTQHVYGKLYHYEEIETDVDAYGKYSQDKNATSSEMPSGNFKRFLKAYKEKNNIVTMYHERNGINGSNEDKKIHQMIAEAKEIIIIGFSFDRDNLDKLGFPRKLGDWRKRLDGKDLKYMDYEGKMRTLATKFENVEKEINKSVLLNPEFSGTCSISRSTAVKIIDAYQNDFKLYLY